MYELVRTTTELAKVDRDTRIALEKLEGLREFNQQAALNVAELHYACRSLAGNDDELYQKLGVVQAHAVMATVGLQGSMYSRRGR
jgi:hypothetical protein